MKKVVPIITLFFFCIGLSFAHDDEENKVSISSVADAKGGVRTVVAYSNSKDIWLLGNSWTWFCSFENNDKSKPLCVQILYEKRKNKKKQK